MMKTEICIEPRSVLRVLLGLVGLLFLAHVILFVLKYGTGHDHVFGLTNLFNLLGERNVPTLFSILLIVLCALCTFCIWWTSRTQRMGWLALSVLLGLLAVDEMAGFHEALAHQLAPQADGNLQFAWAIPYILGTLVIAVIFLPFLRSLPGRFRWWLLGCGALYGGSAAGFEIVSGFFYGAQQVFEAEVVGTIEETLEMVAMALFFYSLLCYLSALPSGPLSLTLREQLRADGLQPSRLDGQLVNPSA